MLKLPSHWQATDGGRICAEWFNHLDSDTNFVDMVIHAVLAVCDNPESPNLTTVHCPAPMAWAVGRIVYVYVHCVEDVELERCVDFDRDNPYVIYVSHPDCENALRKALSFSLRNHFPNTLRFSTFVEMHLLRAAQATGRSYTSTLITFFETYNQLVRESNLVDELSIEPNVLCWIC